jgi:alkanesulfonate monooxygenase SsuD/methylene tetrahydromethanopterin reductase-like flavin-dependent oxidoreductase (luciferase family)
MRTERVHIGANVLNGALRSPAMLTKAVTTLDRLSGGRIELGIGAGGLIGALVGFGCPAATLDERYGAFKESLDIIRGLWASNGEPFTYEGKHHRLAGAKFGPAPTRAIPIWTGALRWRMSRMLRLTGQVADGLLISAVYVPPARLAKFNGFLDEGAAQAGRPVTAIRRGYNLMGVIDLGADLANRPTRPGAIVSDAGH